MVTFFPLLIARVMDDSDFLKLKEVASTHDGWALAYERNDFKVWSMALADSSIKMIKVWAIFSGISSMDLYNTLMDPDYRKVWDTHVILFYDIGYLNYNNEITYYAVSFPPPLRSRDFVLQTSWLDKNTEHFILNHSVCHKDHPPRPGFIRAVSHFTGYFIKGIPNDGCEMFFVSQVDLQGIIPQWIVAKCTQIFAPRIVKQIEQAAAGYSAWKSHNSPDYFPWLKPNNISVISVADCVPSDEERLSPFYRKLANKGPSQQSGPQDASLSSKNEPLSPAATAGTSTFSGQVTETKDRRENKHNSQTIKKAFAKREKRKKCKKL